MKRRQHSTAIEQLKKAVNLFPTNLNLRLNLAQAYQNIGNYDQAKTELEHILANHPDNPKAKASLFNMQVRRGNELVQRKKYRAALTIFEGIPEPQKNANICNMIGYLYSVQSNHLKALRAFESTLAKEPRNNIAYQNIRALESQLAVMLHEKTSSEVTSTEDQNGGDNNAEIEVIKTKLLNIQCALAICLINRRQPKNAMAKYQQALSTKPETTELQKLLVETGRKLANQFQKRNDTKNRDTIIQWVEPLDSNFKDSLEQ